MSTDTIQQGNPELIRIDKVSELTTISKSHIHTLARQGKFPKSHKLGANTSVWLKSDVIQWINDKLGVVASEEASQ